MSDICTDEFFSHVSHRVLTLSYTDLSNYIEANGDSLAVNIALNFDMDALNCFDDWDIRHLAYFFADKYANSLDRVLKALEINYGVLDNTDVTTTENIRTVGSDDLTHGKTLTKGGNDTDSHRGNDLNQSHLTNDLAEGFSTTYDDATTPNTNYRPTQKNTHVADSSSMNTYNSDIQHNYQSNITASGTDSRDTEETVNRGTHRKGNIGITPNQRLVELELSLRAKNRFFNYITSMLVETFSSGVWSDE